MSAATSAIAEAAGGLDISLLLRGGAVQRVDIASTRPRHIESVFEGRTPQQLLHLVPLLYSVCGTAQSCAALRACHGALGIEPPPAAERARQMLVWLETAREHSWRIAADWPKFSAAPQQDFASLRALAPLSGLLTAAKHALFVNGDAFGLDARLQVDRAVLQKQLQQLDSLLDTAIFGGTLAAWRSIDTPTALADWLQDSSSLPARLLKRLDDNGWQYLGKTEACYLPPLSDEKLQASLSRPLDDNVSTNVSWLRKSLETGVLNRQHRHPLLLALQPAVGNGLKARLLARLLELAALPGLLRQVLEELDATTAVPAVYRPDGIGLAQVEAARGLLIHRLELRQGVVRCYQILAPTDWNFAPGGIAARSLQQLTGRCETQLREQAALLIHAIDPCVAYDLAIHGA